MHCNVTAKSCNDCQTSDRWASKLSYRCKLFMIISSAESPPIFSGKNIQKGLKKKPNDRPKRAKKRVFVPKNTCFLAEYFLVELGSPPLTENYSAQKPWAKLGVTPPPLSGSLREPVNYYLTDFSLRVLRWGQMAKKSIRGVGGVGGPPKSAKKNSEKNGFLIKKRLS